MSQRWIERATRAWTRRVRVYAGTRRLAVDLLSGWRLQQRRGVVSPIDTVRFDGDRTAALLAALSEALQALQAEASVGETGLRRLHCDVVLADTWVVYDVVPIDLAQVKPALAQRVISAALADVAGVDQDELVVRWHAQRDGRPFVMAVARRLLDPLRLVLRRSGLELASVTGEFVSVFNAQRRLLTGDRAVFAVGREDGAQIAVVINGSIAATRFELGRANASVLSQAAAGVMRARGDDTGAPIDYVLDASANAVDDARWQRVPPPAWAMP